MKRVSKAPEIRKQELIDVALKLLLEKGYEAVSVREILAEVNGHPGMFYYYFSSKQEIYDEAMKQLIQSELRKRSEILNDKSKPSIIRLKAFIKQVELSIDSFYSMFDSVSSRAYQTKTLLDMLTAMATPVSTFFLELKDDGIIPETSQLNEENAIDFTLFLIYGTFGVIHNEVNTDTKSKIKILENLIASQLEVDVSVFN